MGKRIEMSGRTYGHLTVLEEHSQDASGSIMWLCLCDCGQQSVVRGTHLRRRLTSTCGCRTGYVPTTFTEGVHYNVDESGCWIWAGRMDRNGYGKAHDPLRASPSARSTDWAHRVSYRIHRGMIPDGYDIDHLCENPPCINPDHLNPLTRAEHMRVTNERAGGMPRREMAVAWRAQGMPYHEIGARLGISKNSARDLVMRAARQGIGADVSSLPPQHRRATQDAKHEMVRRYLAGDRVHDIAADTGMDWSSVYRIMRNLGIKRSA